MPPEKHRGNPWFQNVDSTSEELNHQRKPWPLSSLSGSYLHWVLMPGDAANAVPNSIAIQGCLKWHTASQTQLHKNGTECVWAKSRDLFKKGRWLPPVGHGGMGYRSHMLRRYSNVLQCRPCLPFQEARQFRTAYISTTQEREPSQSPF